MIDDQDTSFFYEDCDKYIFSKNLERDLLRLDFSLDKLEAKIKMLNNTIVILGDTDIANIYDKLEENNTRNIQKWASLRDELYAEMFKQFLHSVKSRLRTVDELTDKINDLECTIERSISHSINLEHYDENENGNETENEDENAKSDYKKTTIVSAKGNKYTRQDLYAYLFDNCIFLSIVAAAVYFNF